MTYSREEFERDRHGETGDAIREAKQSMTPKSPRQDGEPCWCDRYKSAGATGTCEPCTIRSLQQALASLSTAHEALKGERDTWKVMTCDPDNGYIILGLCIECRKQYPEWSVSSHMKCPDCRIAAQVEALKAENARLKERT